MIVVYFLVFALSLVVIIKGADFLVDGASSIAKRLKVSDLAIGLTIVAFGTSMPELVVSLFSAINGNTEIAIGNVIGSNISNVFLILGISAIIYPLGVKHGTKWKEIPFSLLAALVLGVLANDALIDGATSSQLSRIDGFVLLSFFAIFMYYVFGVAKSGIFGDDTEDVEKLGVMRSWIYIFAGLAFLVVGGKFAVDMAVLIASSLGISQTLIGLTIVAVGTSLPELATSAVAAYKHRADIAIGNVVGSNIFNIFWILGLSSFIKPLPFRPEANVDIAMVVLSSLLLFAVMFVGERNKLERRDGVIYVLIYVGYVSYLVMRG